MLRISIAVATLFIISGCQHFPNKLKDSTDIKGLTAGDTRFSYHGKELPSQFFLDHTKHRNSGLNYRGYDWVRRHYF